MNEIEILNKIKDIIGGIAASKGAPVPQITSETLLPGGGLPIESLDLALARPESHKFNISWRQINLIL